MSYYLSKIILEMCKIELYNYRNFSFPGSQAQGNYSKFQIL